VTQPVTYVEPHTGDRAAYVAGLLIGPHMYDLSD
jgi:hypothetical protein